MYTVSICFHQSLSNGSSPVSCHALFGNCPVIINLSLQNFLYVCNVYAVCEFNDLLHSQKRTVRRTAGSLLFICFFSDDLIIFLYTDHIGVKTCDLYVSAVSACTCLDLDVENIFFIGFPDCHRHSIQHLFHFYFLFPCDLFQNFQFFFRTSGYNPCTDCCTDSAKSSCARYNDTFYILNNICTDIYFYRFRFFPKSLNCNCCRVSYCNRLCTSHRRKQLFL